MRQLTPDQWKHAEIAFERALELDAVQRDAFLAQLEHDEPVVSGEVRSLLEVREGAGEFLEDSAVARFLNVSKPPHTDHMLGKVIGRCRITKCIARGGMGSVYLAERTDEQFKHRVAIKLVRQELDGNDLIDRFRNERQVLANLTHPNIAQLFDGGTTDDGRPYLIMEYIEGVRIDDYCDRRQLTIEQRLDLFRTVCDAVQHAHQNLVIHRDLKPSNILVTQDGIVKLLDFGIARMLDADGSGADRDLTQTAARRFTPAYASPEQLRSTPGSPISTASDVYSLGAVLYELLTGHRPYALKTGMHVELEEAVCERPATRPSAAVTQSISDHVAPQRQSVSSARTPEQLAALRRTDPGRLRRTLRGDLDAIILTALAKEPQRRFASAQQFSDDISRFMRNEPVIARPPSAIYQTRKFVQRNGLVTATAAGIVLALILAVLGTSVGMIQARTAAAEAQRQTRIAAAVNQFLNEDLLAAIDPEVAQHHDVRMRAVLDQAAANIEGRFHDEPLVAASIRLTLGRTYVSLGDYAAAEPHLEWARGAYQQELGESHPKTLRAKDHIATLYGRQGNFSEAERIHRTIVETSTRINGNTHDDTLTFTANLATVLVDQGRYDEAEALRLDTLDTSRRINGPDHPITIRSMLSLGHLYQAQERHSEAEPLLIEATELAQRIFGERNPTTLQAMNNLAFHYDLQREYEVSVPLHQQIIDAKHDVFGAEHPSTLTSMNNLALAYNVLQQYDEAESLFITVLETSRRVLGPEHPDTINSLNNLGFLYLEWGRTDDALPLLVDAVSLLRRMRGDEHRATTAAMHNLAQVYLDMERYDVAEPLIADLVAATARIAPPGHPAIGMARMMHGQCLTMLGRFELAESSLLDALEIFRSALGEDSPQVRQVQVDLVHLFEAWHQHQPDAGHDATAGEWRTLIESREDDNWNR